jgi:hypothetical protein
VDIIYIDDLAAYLNDNTVTTSVNAALIVELANQLVSDITGDQTTPPARVRAITFEVAARAFRNPEGYSSETIDDYTYRRDAETRRAGVYVTPSEREELLTGDVSASRVHQGWLA